MFGYSKIWFTPLLVFALLTTGCSNQLDITFPAPPTPVAYCIVNPCDSFCYVILSKSTNPESSADKSSLKNSQFKVNDATITLEAWGSGYKLWDSNFKLVENDPDVGVSLTSRSCYKSDSMLLFKSPSVVGSIVKWNYDCFRLFISSPQLVDIAYARIPIIKSPGLVYPRTSMSFNLYGAIESYLRVQLDLTETKYASLNCKFYFKEFTDHWEDKGVEFVVKKDIAIQDELLTIRLTEEQVFNKLSQAITEDPEVSARIFDHVTFILTVADSNFDDYFDTYLNVASNDVRVFTNFINGYGLFTCIRTVEFPSLIFDKQTLDSLSYGQFTKQLKFKIW